MECAFPARNSYPHPNTETMVVDDDCYFGGSVVRVGVDFVEEQLQVQEEYLRVECRYFHLVLVWLELLGLQLVRSLLVDLLDSNLVMQQLEFQL